MCIRDKNRMTFLQTGKLTFGEDAFQDDCALKNKGRSSLINACFTLKKEDSVQDKILLDILVKRTQDFTLSYFKRYPLIYNKIKNKKLYMENTLPNIYDNVEQFDIFPLLAIYSYSSFQLLIIMDHTYIGGYFFSRVGNIYIWR